MKVLVINGSPHVSNTTYSAIKEASDELNKLGIETEIFNVKANTPSCMGCSKCRKDHECAYNDDVNVIARRMKEFDGIIVGTPVYFANASGSCLSFMERLFYSIDRKDIALKPAAAISVSRRSGNTSAFDSLNKFFSITNMVIITSTYWNEVYGYTAEQAKQDKEGMATMRNLARNMAYYLRLRELGKQNGIKEPEYDREVTSFFEK